ncbi:MAG: hypothetical protein COA96_10345 [SAR86 cluster bacterium]|uniref:Uncharacterized protein n=1 Tax=SAR86 cluster bacterium TaxID=2030880 RepID=A0A2A5AZ59_9GAMM|nr:MAG: hypothetical protein COA96_10345 [SAR86 cluster bacterium]
MNLMLELAIKEGHAKRLPSDHDRGGAGNPNVIRKSKITTKLILAGMKMFGKPMTVRQIADKTGLGYSKIYNQMKPLKGRGLVVRSGSVNQHVGRMPSTLWALAKTHH